MPSILSKKRNYGYFDSQLFEDAENEKKESSKHFIVQRQTSYHEQPAYLSDLGGHSDSDSMKEDNAFSDIQSDDNQNNLYLYQKRNASLYKEYIDHKPNDVHFDVKEEEEPQYTPQAMISNDDDGGYQGDGDEKLDTFVLQNVPNENNENIENGQNYKDLVMQNIGSS